MIGNTNHYGETNERQIDIIKDQSPFSYLDTLRQRYLTRQDVLDRIDAIEKKLKEVPIRIQLTVAEILRVNLASNMANTGLMTAAIMAINPANLVGTLSANDDKFELAA